MVKVAFYIAKKGTIIDKIVSLFVRKYSHIEIYINGWCYSISWRDKGGRAKKIDLNDGKWESLELPTINKKQLRLFYQEYQQVKDMPYDFLTLFINSFTENDYDRSPDKTYCFKMIIHIINIIYNKKIPITLMGEDLYDKIKKEFNLKSCNFK